MSAEVVLFGDVNSDLGVIKQAGIHRLATEIREAGYVCQPVDYMNVFMSLEEFFQNRLLDHLIQSSTILVGFSTTLLFTVARLWDDRKHQQFRSLIARIKQRNPNVKFVVGGSYIRSMYKDFICFKFAEIDYLVQGQGEASMLAILNHLRHGESLLGEHLEHQTWITDKDYPYENFARASIRWLPCDLVSFNEVLPMELARGCVFKCAFCSYMLTGKKWGEFTRSEECIRTELIENYDRYGTTSYIVLDDIINDSMEKVEFVHRIFTSLPFKITFTTYARLDLIWKFPQMIPMLYEAGLRSVNFGIETMHAEAGKKVGKGLGEERIKATLTQCRAGWGKDVNIGGLFIIGLPGEPIESVLSTIAWTQQPDCPLDASRFATLYIEPNGASRIDADSSKFGYSESSSAYWKTEFMDYNDATEIERQHREHRQLSATTLQQVLSGWTLAAMQNLKMGNQQVLRNLPHQPSVYEEVARKTFETKVNYFERLLQILPGI